MLGFMGYFLTSVYIFYQSCMFKLLCFNVLLFVDHHVGVVGVVCGCAEWSNKLFILLVRLRSIVTKVYFPPKDRRSYKWMETLQNVGGHKEGSKITICNIWRCNAESRAIFFIFSDIFIVSNNPPQQMYILATVTWLMMCIWGLFHNSFLLLCINILHPHYILWQFFNFHILKLRVYCLSCKKFIMFHDGLLTS